MKQRNETYDLMKGIALVLMMLCHLVYTDGPVKHFIYSFHMPLFFILAGVFAKNIEDLSSFKNFSRKNAKRLLLPYFATMLMLCAWGAIQAIVKHDASFFLRHLFSMLTASADGWQSQLGLIYAGPMWFLVALFLVRELFYGIQYACARVEKYSDELVVGISIILSMASVLIHPYLPSLPFSIMQACTAIGFYAVGWYIHNHTMPWWIYALCVIVWPVAILYGDVAIDSSIVNYYPLSFIGACGGTCVIYLLCKAWAFCLDTIKSKISHRIGSPKSLIEWIGIYSLPILCMHDFLIYSDLMNSIKIRISIGGPFVWGGILAIAMASIIFRIPVLKGIYK